MATHLHDEFFCCDECGETYDQKGSPHECPVDADTDRLNWLNVDFDRLLDVRGLASNEEDFADLRDAIDELRKRQGT